MKNPGSIAKKWKSNKKPTRLGYFCSKIFVFFQPPLFDHCMFGRCGLKSTAAADNRQSVLNEDEDVANERRRVLRGSGRRDLLQLRILSKVYT